MEEERASFSQREPDMRSAGAPKLSFSCKPVSDFKVVSTVKAFFSMHFLHAIKMLSPTHSSQMI